jgi:hypothetical protein
MQFQNKKTLTLQQQESLLNVLKNRFDKNFHRHKEAEWPKLLTKLENNPAKLWSLNAMEETGGEPDVISYDNQTNLFIFCDCSTESPKGRRSVCYDQTALENRKEHKPKHSAIGLAEEMGIQLLTEEQYFALQQLGNFDTKTSSWLMTPVSVRALGGAIFGDFRYGRTFIYHNGAESYYAARGFRGRLLV